MCAEHLGTLDKHGARGSAEMFGISLVTASLRILIATNQEAQTSELTCLR